MNYNRIFTGVIEEIGIDDFRNKINFPLGENKKKILDYMRKFPPVAFTSAPVYDKFSGEIVFEANNMHFDGIFAWFESEIYHFEKYDLKLNDDFIDQVLNNI